MQQQQHVPSSRFDDLKAVSNWLNFIVRSWAVTVEIFLHAGFGHRYLGLQAAAGFPLMLLFVALWPGHNPIPMMIFLWVVMAMCIYARICALCMRRGGESIHSLYSGRPRIGRWLPWMDELTVKGRVEPAIVFIVGLAVMPLNIPLGMYLFIASFALAGSVSAVATYERIKAVEALDSIIEARQHAERVRAMAGNHL